MTETQVIVAVLGVYILALVGLAVWSSKGTRDPAGYFIAGKKLPFWVVAFSANATGESGWLLLGVTGMAYAVGVHAFWVPLGELVGVALSWLLIARRLKRETDQSDSITLLDYLDSQVKDRLQLLRLAGALIIIVMVLTYVTSQMVAAGKAFSEFINVTFEQGVLIGAVVTLFYTTIGGYKAVAYTDLVQGVLMLLALALLPTVAIIEIGGVQALVAGLQAADASLLSGMGEHGWGLVGVLAVASFLGIGLPFMGVPQFLIRYMSIKSPEQVPKAAALSIATITCFGVGAVCIGLAGRVLFPGLEDAETVMPTLSRELFPPLVTGVLVVVLLAAIMSTVDSLLILLSSAVTRDLLQKIIKPNFSAIQLWWGLRRGREALIKPDFSDLTLARIGKGATLVVGLLAFSWALYLGDETLFWFILFAWSGLGAAFGPVVLCMLLWRKVTLPGALAGVVGGFATTMLWGLVKADYYNFYEAIPGFIVGFALVVGVSKLSRR